MSLSEFDLINRYFTGLTAPDTDVELGIGDDAAVVNVPPGQSLVMSLDTLVSGIHFPDNTAAEEIGWKSLAVNLSDMAAMAAEPRWVLLGLSLPQVDDAWLQGFCKGLGELARKYEVTLIGGDMTCGPLTITVQINGLVPHGQALRRSGAQPGDLVYVSGQLGDAGLGLALARGDADIHLSASREQYFLQRLHRPTPRLDLGRALRGIASAAIDISDGLVSDLGHVLKSSHVGAVIHVEQIPCADEQRMLHDEWRQLPLTAGDDYELCFTLPPDQQQTLEQRLSSIDCACHCIGHIEAGKDVRILHHGDVIETADMKGYMHFE